MSQGALESLGLKRPVYLACLIASILIPLLLSIPAAVHSGVVSQRQKIGAGGMVVVLIIVVVVDLFFATGQVYFVIV